MGKVLPARGVRNAHSLVQRGGGFVNQMYQVIDLIEEMDFAKHRDLIGRSQATRANMNKRRRSVKPLFKNKGDAGHGKTENVNGRSTALRGSIMVQELHMVRHGIFNNGSIHGGAIWISPKTRAGLSESLTTHSLAVGSVCRSRWQ